MPFFGESTQNLSVIIETHIFVVVLWPEQTRSQFDKIFRTINTDLMLIFTFLVSMDTAQLNSSEKTWRSSKRKYCVKKKLSENDFHPFSCC